MDTLFLINKTKSGISVSGLELFNNKYVDEDQELPILEYRFSDTETLNIVAKLNSSEEIESTLRDIQCHFISSEGNNLPDTSEFTLTEDGLYKILHVIVPTLDWADAYTEKYATYPWDNVYIGTASTITKNGETVDDEEILNLSSNVDHNLVIGTKYTFSVENLETCYYLACKALLNKICSSRCAQTEIPEYKNWKLLFVIRHVIQYQLECESYIDAQKTLEDSIVCGGLCSDTDSSTNTGGTDCGCGS